MSRLYYLVLLALCASNSVHAFGPFVSAPDDDVRTLAIDEPIVTISPLYPQRGQYVTLKLPVKDCDFIFWNPSPGSYSVTEDSGTIRIVAHQIPNGICPAVGPGGYYWHLWHLEIGKGNPGNYLVEYELRSSYDDSIMYQGDLSFVVGSAIGVPINSTWALILLVTMLVVAVSVYQIKIKGKTWTPKE